MGNKKTFIWLIVVAVWLYGAINAYRMYDNLRGRQRIDPINVAVPKGTCPSSLAVFNFRPHGEPDAKYYAIGFARALADRTYCAPKHVTQQLSANEIAHAVSKVTKDPRTSVSDAAAVKIGKKMAASYVVTGDLKLSKGKVKIDVSVIDVTNPSAKRSTSFSSNLSEIGKLQPRIAREIVLKINQKLVSANPQLSTCNFSSHGILKLYGQSYLTTDAKQREQLRWKMVQSDPKGSFAFARLLDFYNASAYYCAELRNNTALTQALAEPPAAFADNSEIEVMRGLAYARQCRYDQAESVLKSVTKSDPEMIRTHSALAYVARLRQNAELAVAESESASNAWPNNATLHAALADSYSTAANSVRHGHYYNEFTASTERRWHDYCRKSLEQAYIAVKIDPNCIDGWFSILDNALQLSRPADREKAYENLRRLDPRNTQVYTSYAFCFSPQWGGFARQQEQIFRQAEEAFPKGSYKPLVVKALSLSCNFVSDTRVGGPYGDELLRLADQISNKTGDKCEDALNVKSQAYEITRRRADFLKVCEAAYKKYGGLTWQYRLGMGCAFAYEDRRDRAYLERAHQLFADYSKQVPFDPRGYVQVGWCLSHLGKRAEAKTQFEKALQIDPGNESAKEKMKYVQ